MIIQIIMGKYTEKLKSGGELIVTESNWLIEYYFSGPDLRYNGTFVRLQGRDIDKYIAAWKNNYKKYTELKSVVPTGGTYEVKGEAGMTIRVGGWREGVCIDGYHMNTKDSQKIDSIVNDYKTAKEKAIKIQNILKTL